MWLGYELLCLGQEEAVEKLFSGVVKKKPYKHFKR